ncbi:MAG: hypothetical protein HGB12_08945, partial [Bacteroidetes bacterium]|nr:hypothetical protein [Bacteroidota bacterium]
VFTLFVINVNTAAAWSLTGNTGTTAGTNFIGTSDNKDFVFKTNNTEWARITSGGNVGIGTTSPNALFHVYNSTSPRIRLETGSGGFSRLEFFENNLSKYQIGYNESGLDAKFGIFDNGAATWAVTLTGGNVGIGTTRPLGKTHIFTTSSDGNVSCWGTGQLVVGQEVNTGGVGISYNTSNNTGVINALSPGIAWRNLVLQSNGGNVGIGTNVPTELLHLYKANADVAIRYQSTQSTATFNYTGSQQTWVVPGGVTSITVDVMGAQGAPVNSLNILDSYYGLPVRGGRGGRTQGDISVTPGETLYLYVGGAGVYASGGVGGYNGGGNGCSPGGHGGGGASDIRRGGTALANRVIVAAGGGGDAGNVDCRDGGSGGGLTGIAGWGCWGNDGGGATQTAGGAGGGGKSAGNGSLGIGGVGVYDGNANRGGGGGGGGYYGGGGAFSGAVGGGGSSLVPAGGSTTSDYKTEYGQIIITYNLNWVSGTDNSDAGKFKISAGTSMGTSDYFTINGNGNVGIGTVNPGSKLSVVGLPTSAAGLSSGDIWRDAANGNVLKVVP